VQKIIVLDSVKIEFFINLHNKILMQTIKVLYVGQCWNYVHYS
jgi:hypothetical protein